MAGEYCFAITQAVDSHASAIQVPLCQNLDLNWTVLCMFIYIYVCLYIYTGSAKKMYTYFNERKLYVV